MDMILLIPILASFFVTLFLVPSWISRAKKAGLTGKDINKYKGKKVAEAGGVTTVLGFALGVLVYIAINTFVFNRSERLIEIFALTSCIFFIAFIAFTDDILGWKIGLRRRTRLILVALASIPLVAINAGKSVIGLPFMGALDVGIAYPLIFIPLGIVGATTTYNFLAGFNGLETGQGIILLSALSVVAYFTGSPWLSVVALCMVAALVAFLVFNFNPAVVFPGDSLTYPIGGLIACMAILGNFEKIAIFFFIPYIVEVFLKGRGRYLKQSFGKPNKDGSISVKYDKIYSLNHAAIKLMEKIKVKPTEMKAVLLIWFFQILVILVGFALFWEGLFQNV